MPPLLFGCEDGLCPQSEPEHGQEGPFTAETASGTKQNIAIGINNQSGKMAAAAAEGVAGKSNYGICLSLQRLTKQKENQSQE